MQSSLIEQRVLYEAKLMIQEKSTTRKVASKIGYSKTTVHKDLTERLPMINHKMYLKVREVLDYNLEERAIRGGVATKNKYLDGKQRQTEIYSACN
ncbi:MULTISPECIES: sporulation transcriptional regulator SpoIIID [Clostridium]|jgi:putative DeoR family transcriptional regulator (stage III sporulation protein D)|uniref:sporulation transcriptional regulator SpoIIID n=1 Tax=Clostridium TaxID=1485 RepID=UPI0024318B19|nr:sporulation transcriptional regulator SpoIIID [Clostridium tyrobutyricum]